VPTNPAFPSSFLTYPSGRYSGTTRKYHIQGGELLDAFVFANHRLGEVPVYFKAGRFTQQWGNALFDSFGRSPMRSTPSTSRRRSLSPDPR